MLSNYPKYFIKLKKKLNIHNWGAKYINIWINLQKIQNLQNKI